MAEGVIDLHRQSIEYNEELIELDKAVCLNAGGLIEEDRTRIIRHLDEGISCQSKVVGPPAKYLVGTPCDVDNDQDAQCLWLMGATFRNNLYDDNHPAVAKDKEHLTDIYKRFLDNGGGDLDLDGFLKKRD